MASIDEGVIQHLLTVSGVTTLTSTRIAAPPIPQGTALPYIEVEWTGSEPQYHSTAEAGIHDSQVSARCFAATSIAARNVAEQVRVALSGKPAGDLGGVNMRRIVVEDIRDAHIAPGAEGDEVGTPGAEVLLRIWHNATIPSFS